MFECYIGLQPGFGLHRQGDAQILWRCAASSGIGALPAAALVAAPAAAVWT
jgi:hypothetical protein